VRIALSAIVVVLIFALAPAALSQDVTVVAAFPGASGPGPKDCPVNTGAVGPQHVMDFTNANVVIHDKTGKVASQMTQTEFWKEAKPGFDLPVLNDPRLLYDPLCGRWFGAAAAGEKGKGEAGYLAVSETSDPTKGWHGVKLPMPPTDAGMKLGVDRNGLYIAFYVMTGDIHTMMSVHAIAKADAIAAEGPDLSNLQTFNSLEIECFPETDLDPDKAADAPEILLNREFGNTFANLHLYRITWAGKTASISKMETIPLSRTYVSPNGSSKQNTAAQPTPGGRLRADEGRRTQCVYRHGGSLFACNEAKSAVDSRPGIFWCEVRAKDAALLQEALIESTDCDYLAPSLAVDSSGNVGIGCTRTSEKEYPSAVVMMRAAGDPKNTMRPPVVAVKGTMVFKSSRNGAYGIQWGNYNATCVDPEDPSVIWTTQEYAGSEVVDKWTTCWVAFRLR
jgi:hypothetical protein